MTALAPLGWRAWVRRHERRLAASWLAAVALLLLALAAPPSRRALLSEVQALADRWDARWTGRLAWGDTLVARRRYPEAVAYLERLDAVFPARNAREARNQQREHLFDLLARSYEALGRKSKAMATYNRLVAFDSLNYYNHYLRATAAERMLSGWAVAAEARDGFAGALRVYPNHLPSLRGYIQYYSDRSDWRPVVDAYESYLNAFLVQRLTVRAGDSAITTMVAVDGRPQVVTVPLPSSGAGTAVISADGFAFALDSAQVIPPARVGKTAGAPDRLATARAALFELTPADNGAWRPTGDSAAATLPLPRAETADGSLRLVVRLFKPVDAALWDAVTTSYRNLLESARSDAAARRTVVFPARDEADAVLWRLPSARAGLPAPPRAAP